MQMPGCFVHVWWISCRGSAATRGGPHSNPRRQANGVVSCVRLLAAGGAGRRGSERRSGGSEVVGGPESRDTGCASVFSEHVYLCLSKLASRWPDIRHDQWRKLRASHVGVLQRLTSPPVLMMLLGMAPGGHTPHQLVGRVGAGEPLGSLCWYLRAATWRFDNIPGHCMVQSRPLGSSSRRSAWASAGAVTSTIVWCRDASHVAHVLSGATPVSAAVASARMRLRPRWLDFA